MYITINQNIIIIIKWKKMKTAEGISAVIYEKFYNHNIIAIYCEFVKLDIIIKYCWDIYHFNMVTKFGLCG